MRSSRPQTQTQTEQSRRSCRPNRDAGADADTVAKRKRKRNRANREQYDYMSQVRAQSLYVTRTRTQAAGGRGSTLRKKALRFSLAGEMSDGPAPPPPELGVCGAFGVASFSSCSKRTPLPDAVSAGPPMFGDDGDDELAPCTYEYILHAHRRE